MKKMVNLTEKDINWDYEDLTDWRKENDPLWTLEAEREYRKTIMDELLFEEDRYGD